MSLLDSLTRKHTPRIKQRVASCHTAEVISIQSLTAPPHTPRGQPISEVGWWNPTMLGMDVLTWPPIDPIVLDFPIFPALGNGSAQNADFWSENRLKLWVFAPQIFRRHV